MCSEEIGGLYTVPYYGGDQVEDDGMGGKCSRHR